MTKTTAIFLAAMGLFGGLAAYLFHQKQAEKAKISSRMAKWEVEMWSQVKCARCSRNLDAYHPMDGLYSAAGKTVALHESCAKKGKYK